MDEVYRKNDGQARETNNSRSHDCSAYNVDIYTFPASFVLVLLFCVKIFRPKKWFSCQIMYISGLFVCLTDINTLRTCDNRYYRALQRYLHPELSFDFIIDNVQRNRSKWKYEHILQV